MSYQGEGLYRVRTERGTSVLFCREVITPNSKGAQLIGGWRSQKAVGDVATAQLMLPMHQFDQACIGMVSPLEAG